MDHQLFSSPVQYGGDSMASFERNFFAREDEEGCAHGAFTKKAAMMVPSPSASRSPTTVFAVDEQNLSSVFRVPDDAVERGTIVSSRQGGKEIGGRRRCLTASFTTDEEMSTFSEDTSEDDNEDSEEGFHLRFPSVRPRRRSPPMSIFRPSSGMKRRCDFECSTGVGAGASHPRQKQRRSESSVPPALCLASPIGEPDSDDETTTPSSSLSMAYSFESPFKRICSRGLTAAASRSDSCVPSFASLFAAAAVEAQGHSSVDRAAAAPDHLQHPLSFETSPMPLKSNSIVDGYGSVGIIVKK